MSIAHIDCLCIYIAIGFCCSLERPFTLNIFIYPHYTAVKTCLHVLNRLFFLVSFLTKYQQKSPHTCDIYTYDNYCAYSNIRPNALNSICHINIVDIEILAFVMVRNASASAFALYDEYIYSFIKVATVIRAISTWRRVYIPQPNRMFKNNKPTTKILSFFYL